MSEGSTPQIEGITSTELLGRDGPASVYRGVDSVSDTSVLIKQWSITGVEMDSDALSAAMTSLAEDVTKTADCPGVIPVLRVGLSGDGFPYLITLQAEGRPASALIARRVGIPWDRAVSIVDAAAASVASAHARGLVHGGLRPAAVVEAASGAVHIGDYVAARLSNQIRPSIWTAPEVVGADPSAPTPHSDVYGLGITLAGLVLGRGPAGDGTRFRAVQLTDQGLPEAVAEVVTIATARDPEHRHPSVESFRRDLQSAVASAGGELSVAPAAAVLTVPATASATSPARASSDAGAAGSAERPAVQSAEAGTAQSARSEQRVNNSGAGDSAASDSAVADSDSDSNSGAAAATAVPTEPPVYRDAVPAAAANSTPKTVDDRGATAPLAEDEVEALQRDPGDTDRGDEDATETGGLTDYGAGDSPAEADVSARGSSRLALLLVPLIALLGVGAIAWAVLAGDDPTPAEPADQTVVTDTIEEPPATATADDTADLADQTDGPADNEPTVAPLEAALTCPAGYDGPDEDDLCTQALNRPSGAIVWSCPDGGELVGEECITPGAETYVPGDYVAGTPGRSSTPASCPAGYSFSGGTCVGSVASATEGVCPGAASLGAVVSVDRQFCTVAAFPGTPGWAATPATCDGIVTDLGPEECGSVEVGDDIVVPAQSEQPRAECHSGYEDDGSFCVSIIPAS